MDKKQRIKELLNRLGDLESKTVDSMRELNATVVTDSMINTLIDEKVAPLKEKLKDNLTVQSLQKLNNQIVKLKKEYDIKPFLTAIDEIRTDVDESQKQLVSSYTEKLAKFENELKKELASLQNKASTLNDEKFSSFEEEFLSLQDEFAIKEAEIEQNILSASESVDALFEKVNKRIDSIKIPEYIDKSEELKSDILKEIEDKVEKVKKEFMSRLGNIGGGAQNRKITFGGVDYLTKYTDINYKAGSNVTFTVVSNNTTKMVDVTIASSGGGGGSVRSINSISSDETAGDASGTDYVYLVSGTTTLTLPTAVANTNLYTVKNVGTGVVTIATTGGETIDNDTTIIMPVRYTSVDLISDTTNWNVT